MRFTQQVTYPILGALLGSGAPAGSFLLRFLACRNVRERPADELRANAFFYLYELLATSLIFSAAGFVAGRRADHLRQRKTFYHELAEHDSLTGLHNSGAFADRYRRALERAAAAGEPISVILIDVDQLKAINDAFGHAAGSEALVHVAGALRASKRAADVAARWGGDEFAIVLDGADEAGAMRVAEELIAYLRNSPLQCEGKTVPVSVTIGICTAARPTASTDVFGGADRALLAGKAHGRNTIEVASI